MCVHICILNLLELVCWLLLNFLHQNRWTLSSVYYGTMILLYVTKSWSTRRDVSKDSIQCNKGMTHNGAIMKDTDAYNYHFKEIMICVTIAEGNMLLSSRMKESMLFRGKSSMIGIQNWLQLANNNKIWLVAN